MSFLTWAGGKSKVMHHIVDHVPKTMRNYYEPFVGGASILLYVLQQVEAGTIEVRGEFVCADINMPLILCYVAVKEKTEAVICSYKTLCETYEHCCEKSQCRRDQGICLCKECYYFAIRMAFNAMHQLAKASASADPCDYMVEIASHFLFLNATCYRGLYRESKSGLMNSCYWTRRSIIRRDEEIREAGRLFAKYDVQFRCSDFREFLQADVATFDPLDFVMLDPPYVPARESSHVSDDYSQQGFGEDDTNDLVQWMRQDGNRVMFTYCNHHCKRLEAQLKHMPVYKTFQVRRSMRYSGKADVAHEMLVSSVLSDIRRC